MKIANSVDANVASSAPTIGAAGSVLPWGCALQNSRTMSYPALSGVSDSVAMISCGDLPPYIGWISGWTIDTVPSTVRASLQCSR